MVNESTIANSDREVEGIDFEKLKTVFRRNLHWLILIFLITNILAYLYIRWTKPLFEASSQLRLDLKQDATIVGIPTFEDNQSNLIAGEIELIRSKLFLSKVIDNLDLNLSYYAVGDILIDEKFNVSPIQAEIISSGTQDMDRRVYVNIVNAKQFQINFDQPPTGDDPLLSFGKKIRVENLQLKLYLTNHFEVDSPDRLYFFILNSRETLVQYLAKNLNVDYDNVNANTILISFQDNNASKAQSLVNAIDTLYLEYTKQKKNQENEQKIAWLNSELGKIENELEGFENYFEDFTISNKTNDLNEDLKKTLSMMNALDSQQYIIENRLAKVHTFMNNIDKDVKADMLEADPNIYPENVRETFKDLQETTMEMDQLKLSYNETTFAYKQKEETINTLRELLSGQLTIISDRLSTELARIKEQRSTLESNFSQIPGKSTEYNKKLRYFNLYEEFLLTLMQSKAEFEIAKAGTNTDFVILSAPSLPHEPISPNALLIHGIGIVSGLVLSIFMTGIFYLAHNKITSSIEIERETSTPILGSVPKSREKINQTQLVIDKRPKSSISEALRAIRTNIDFFVNTNEHQIISVTSTIGGEGKTFVSVNLGGIFALSNRKVILLDLDMRKPRVHLAFNDTNQDKGISTILINKYSVDESIRQTNLPFMDYIAAGPTPPNPAELLMSAKFEELLRHLKETYDIVIMDTPPVGLVTDGVLAMKKASLALYIIRANYSKREFIHTVSKLTKDNKFQKIAIILNALPLTKSNSYGYGYYDERPDESILSRA